MSRVENKMYVDDKKSLEDVYKGMIDTTMRTKLFSTLRRMGIRTWVWNE